MATLRDVLAKLSEMPEQILDLEFAVFDSTTGTRVMFSKGVSDIRIAQSFGRVLIEFQGSQDVEQMTTPPQFPGKL